jgi:uncharacterized protein (TIGR02996 family)
MNDEEALLRAIIAHSGEDTPRLAYADWLEEHDNPDRAAFIRTQCAYTAISPTQREYPDLQEAYWRDQARCEKQLKAERWKLPPGFAYPASAQDILYRRGFLHSVCGAWRAANREPTDEEVTQVCEGLESLLANTTIRKLLLPHLTSAQFARVLDAPGIDRLETFVIGPHTHDGDEAVQLISTADALRGLLQLHLHFQVRDSGAHALGQCKFDRLEYLDLPGFDCEPSAVGKMVKANWFHSLKQVECSWVTSPVMPTLLAALAELPQLEHLALGLNHRPLANTFPKPDSFRELAQLFITGEFAPRSVKWLAAAQMPKLIELRVNRLTNNAFRTLRSAPWFRQLWMLFLNNGTLNDKSVAALTRCELPELRHLQLGDNPFGRDGLLALADGSRLAALTSLNLNTTSQQTTPAADVAAFVGAINRPGLRNLWLANWPLGTEGAEALAANPSLANLTSLSVYNCGISSAGVNAIIRSPNLQNLVELNISENELRPPTALLDSNCLPQLRQCWLCGHKFDDTTVAKLIEARDWHVEFGNE